LAIFNGIQKMELYLAPVKFLIRTDNMNFKHFLNAKIDRQLARGRLLSWQIWFQQYEFDVEWIPGNTNWLADAMTREMKEMNKAFRVKLLNPNIALFELQERDSLQTLAIRMHILDREQPNAATEIKKVIGMRLQRNKWITKCRAYKTRNIGTSLNIPNELCRIYASRRYEGKYFLCKLG
jgi:hypothetical protein